MKKLILGILIGWALSAMSFSVQKVNACNAGSPDYGDCLQNQYNQSQSVYEQQRQNQLLYEQNQILKNKRNNNC